jgi:uncharacterized membrane protein
MVCGMRVSIKKTGISEGIAIEQIAVILDGFDRLDALAMLLFVAAWMSYHIFIERTERGARSLNARMHGYRQLWMREMLKREVRVVDSTIMSTLQSGTAFFASTSLFAIGGSLAMLQAADAAIRVFDDLPFAEAPTASEFELKVIGLATIFVYAFFKFAWSYRLFNYAAILMGAVPEAKRAHEPTAIAAADQAAAMNTVAGMHFNRGQRAFFFALAYLGWFLHALFFIIATLAALIVIWRRQFASDAIKVLDAGNKTSHIPPS